MFWLQFLLKRQHSPYFEKKNIQNGKTRKRNSEEKHEIPAIIAFVLYL